MSSCWNQLMEVTAMLTTLTAVVLAIVQANALHSTKSVDRLNNGNRYFQLCCDSNHSGNVLRFKNDKIKEIIFCSKIMPNNCPLMLNTTALVYTDCQEWYDHNYIVNGVYRINPDENGQFEVYCDMETDGGGWTVFQRRIDGSVDFYRNWTDYEQGFGNLTGEFWLGLTKIHRLTSSGNSKQLRIDLGDFENNYTYAKYSSFTVGDSTTNYTLHISGYSGDAGDSLTYHNGSQFSTKDQDNNNCAVSFRGAWWYNNCYHSNLNGLYLPQQHSTLGVTWYHWNYNYYSLRFTEMKLS